MESDSAAQILFLLLLFIGFSRERAAKGITTSIKVLQYRVYFLPALSTLCSPSNCKPSKDHNEKNGLFFPLLGKRTLWKSLVFIFNDIFGEASLAF